MAKIIDLSEEISVDGKVAHDVDIVIDRLIVDKQEENRLIEGVAAALEVGSGLMSVFTARSRTGDPLFAACLFPKVGALVWTARTFRFLFQPPQWDVPDLPRIGACAGIQSRFSDRSRALDRRRLLLDCELLSDSAFWQYLRQSRAPLQI